jgi:hypothetical protein
MGTLKRGEYAPRNEQDELDIESQARALQHYALERGYVVELLVKSNPKKPVTGAHSLGVAMRRVRAGSPLTAFVGLSNKPLAEFYQGNPAGEEPVTNRIVSYHGQPLEDLYAAQSEEMKPLVAAFTDVFKEESQ